MAGATHRVAIVGGSGLQALSNFELKETVNCETPWGRPSAVVCCGLLDGNEIFFMPRHGGEQAIPPHKINYRANIAALHQLNIDSILAFNAVGGISARCQSGVLMVPDQIIDYTWGREHTFWDAADGDLLHAEFSLPYDENLRKHLLSAGKSIGQPLLEAGTYGVTQGPRLETAAEIVRMEKEACDIVGMTGMPEAGLAREKNIAYACLALVVNPAAGIGDTPINMDDISAVMNEGIPKAERLLSTAVAQLLS